MLEKSPLIFKPYLKPVIWGGNKICEFKGIPQEIPNIGESWEISAIPGHESIVAEGTYKGQSLTELVTKFGVQLLGRKVKSKYGLNFPLLVKLIDANDNLSVQVHPNDSLAKERHNCLGKTEMWYIIQSDRGAKILSGFRKKINPEDYINRIENGTFEETLAIHDSLADDIFFLPAGRVHSIGSGNLLAEIQETSDITYRIYDYDRTDTQGNKRELHTLEAKEAIDYNIYPDYKFHPVSNKNGITKLTECEHFITHRILLDKELDLYFDSTTFIVLICLDGEATIKYDGGETDLKKGRSVLIPASLNHITLKGKAKLLMAHS